MPDITTSLRIPRYASAPGSPLAGQLYYNTTSNTLFFYNGTAWTQLGASGAGLPSGGVAFDFLEKQSTTDFDTAWNTWPAVTYAGVGTVTTTSTAAVMSGVGDIITPRRSGYIICIIQGRASHSAANAFVGMQWRWGGTGLPVPATGTAAAGTTFGQAVFTPNNLAAAIVHPYTIIAAANLGPSAIGASYWFSISFQGSGAGTSSLFNNNVVLIEH